MSADLVFQYFPELNDIQKDQIRKLQRLYQDWNEKINVISRKDIDFLYEKHILHSLAIAKYIQFKPGTQILDVGTGGGLPGIPLAILFPSSNFLLVDSIGKKIQVVNAIVHDLDLKNVNASHGRAETINEQFDFVVSRAVAKTKELYQWTHQLIRRNTDAEHANGYLLLKGGDLEEEMKDFGKAHAITDLRSYFDLPFFETKKLIYIPV